MINQETTEKLTIADLFASLDYQFERLGLKRREVALLKIIARLSEGRDMFMVSLGDIAARFCPRSKRDNGKRSVARTLKAIEGWQTRNDVYFFHRQAGSRFSDRTGQIQFVNTQFFLLRLFPIAHAFATDDREALEGEINVLSQIEAKAGDQSSTSTQIYTNPERLQKIGLSFLTKGLRESLRIGTPDALSRFVDMLESKLMDVTRSEVEAAAIRTFLHNFDAEALLGTVDLDDDDMESGGWGQNDPLLTINTGEEDLF